MAKKKKVKKEEVKVVDKLKTVVIETKGSAKNLVLPASFVKNRR